MVSPVDPHEKGSEPDPQGDVTQEAGHAHGARYARVPLPIQEVPEATSTTMIEHARSKAIA
jgi:hypothetical protein